MTKLEISLVFSNNGKSVVDYMICSTCLFESVKNFGVGEEDFSDHFLLYCTLSLYHETFSQSDLCILNETNLHDCLKMRWKPELEDQFITKFSELF